MAEIIEFFKENKKNSKIVTLAEEYLLQDTLSKNLKGDAKIKELDGMNMESKFAGKIIPSMIYTFIYDTKKEMQLIDDITFGDKMPIVLCCDVKEVQKEINGKKVKGINLIGINLNFLRPEQRAVILDTLFSKFSGFYNNLYKDVYANKASINIALANVLKKSDLIKNIQTLTKIDISKCVRSYNISFAKNIRLIEYNLWKYIPLYEAQRTISGISIKKLQEIISKK